MRFSFSKSVCRSLPALGFSALGFSALGFSALGGLVVASGCSDAGDGTATGGSNFSGGAANGGSGAASGGNGASSGDSGTAANGGSGNNGGTLNLPDGGQGDSGVDLDSGCASDQVTGERLPANLLLVIDRSGSMNCNLPPLTSSLDCEAAPIKDDINQPSKWEVTRDALEGAIDQLELSGNVSVGLSMFPRDDDCSVSEFPNIPMEALTSLQNTALDAFLQAVVPKGRTPLAGASILSYRHFLTRLQAGDIDGNHFVVLLSDGFETCAPSELDKLINTDVPNAADPDGLNIRTFVIGAPGSEGARSLLSQIAKNGGTASTSSCTADPNGAADVGDCHFDLTTTTDFAAELASTLEAISGTVLTCEFDIPQNPNGGEVNLGLVNVSVTPDGGNEQQLVQDTTDCDSSADGWQYNADQTKIVLCGPACETAKTEGSAVSIVLGCPIVTR